MTSPTSSLTYRVGMVGCPSKPDVPWTADNVEKLKALGFNTLQLNIAWGSRPADEPLNLEDVVEIPAGRAEEFTQPVPLRGDRRPRRFEERRAALRERIALCRAAGMRTIFHFGAPFNAHMAYGDNPPNCLLDGRTPARYAALIELFHEQFPGVDDLWLYTYDQDAWLCSEFGDCPRCAGIPLHRRVSGFVNELAGAWRRLQPAGRTWWEPWELSAGQVYQSIPRLNAQSVGLAVHSNVAEVMAVYPVDHWLKMVTRLAREAGLPVIVEHFLGSATEELEPFLHVACPQTLLRGLRAITALPIDGIKEYYGLRPEANDANLKLTGIVLNHPGMPDAEVLRRLAVPYVSAAEKIIPFWETTSAAIDLFPWAASWWIRNIGTSDPCHGMGAAFLRGQQAHTPSWESSRRSIFMKTDDLQPDAWMLEDVQLQCELSAERLARALGLGAEVRELIPPEWRAEFKRGLTDLYELRRRVLAYAYHIRETNLAILMRRQREKGAQVSARLVEELLAVLGADQANQGRPEPCASAIALLKKDVDAFLESYFVVPRTDASSAPDEERPVTDGTAHPWGHRGRFSVTSR